MDTQQKNRLYRPLCLILLIPAVLGLCTSPAWSLSWNAWDIQHGVAKRQDWMVIKEPGRDGCYLKQAYANTPKKMDLVIDATGVPCLFGPFGKQPLDLKITYQVDYRPEKSLVAHGVTNGIKLPKALVKRLKRGYSLTVTVQPLDAQKTVGTVTSQKFSLHGLIATTEIMRTSDVCQPFSSQ